MPTGRHIDMVGQTFGKWTVLERAGKSAKSQPIYRCTCTCGTEGLIRGDNLRAGRSKSCISCSKVGNTFLKDYINRLKLAAASAVPQ